MLRFTLSRARFFQIMTLACLAIVLFSLVALMLGPFQGLEAQMGLNDKQAHLVAFYGLTIAVMLGLPKIRKTDVLLMMIAFGGLIEVVQTFTGRSGSLGDWAADSAGTALALLPLYVRDFNRNRLSRRQVMAEPDKSAKPDQA
jgi:VanZ family protein